jgi:hypothetical protein
VRVAAVLAMLVEERQRQDAEPPWATEERIEAEMDALEAPGALDGRALELARALVAARRQRLAAAVR